MSSPRNPVVVRTGPVTPGSCSRWPVRAPGRPRRRRAGRHRPGPRGRRGAGGAETPAYGISTGFGALATRQSRPSVAPSCSARWCAPHAAGSGPEVEREVVRALMLLRLSTLATGHTGVRPETAQLLADLLTHDITPVVHEHGSLGCSGDLAPLAHCALALMGEGQVRDASGAMVPAAGASPRPASRAGRAGRQEGLALINGTDGMLGMLVMAVEDLTGPPAHRRHRRGHVGRGAARDRPRLRPGLQALRPHPGRRRRLRTLVALLADSGVVASHRGPGLQPGPGRLLAALLPAGARRRAGHGGPRRAGGLRELASAVDNPVVLASEGRVESNGNFHGAPVAYVLTSSRSSQRTSRRSASAVPTASSTRPATTACRRSSPTTRGRHWAHDRPVHRRRSCRR